MDQPQSETENSEDTPSWTVEELRSQAEPVPPRRDAPGVKAHMRQWSVQNPEKAAVRAEERRRDGKNRKVRMMLSQLIGQETIEKAHMRLDELLDAEQPVVVNLPGEVRDGKPVPGGQEVQFVADNKARLEAVKVVAAYTEGLPVARQINIQADFQSLDDERRALLMGSSAVQEALGELEDVARDEEDAKSDLAV